MPAARRPRARRTSRRSAAALRERGLRRDAARTRCRPSSASTSGRSRPSSTPTCGRACRAYLRRLADAGRRGAGDDLGRRAASRSATRPSCPPPCCCRGRPAACGPAPPWPPPTGSPTPSPSTWAARAPTCAWCSTARPSRRPSATVGGLPGPAAVARRPHDRRRRRLDRPHRPRRRAGRRARRAPAPSPGPACYGRGGTEPTVTDADLVAGRIPADAALPGLGRSTSTAARGAALDAGRASTAEGVIAVVDAGDGAGAAGGVGRAGRRPRGLALVAFGGAGPLHACALADALGHAGGDRAGPGRRAVGGRAAARAAPARPGAVVADAGATTTGSTTALADARPREAAAAVGGRRRRRGRRPRVDCRYAGQSHELTVPTVDDFHDEHRRRNGYARPGDAGRGGRPAGHGRAGRAPVAVADLPAPGRPAGRPSGPAVIAEPDCTDLGRRRAGGPSPARPARSCSRRARRERACVTLDPAALAGADLPAHRRRRGDGRGAAPGRVQPEHQGAGRLLGRAVHRRRRAAGAGRAHPGAPRVDAGVGARPPSTRFGDGSRPGDQVVLNDPFAGGTHLNDITLVAPVLRRRRGWSAGPPTGPTTPTSAAPRPGSIPADATEIYQEGLRIPPVAARPTRCAALLLANSRTPDERRGDLDAQVGANVVGVERLAGRSAGAPFDEVVDYGERRMRAALAALPDGTWTLRRRARLDRRRARPAASRRRIAVTRDDRRRRGHVRLHRHRRRSGRGNVNAVEAVTVSRGGVRAAVAPSTRRSRPTAARCGRCAVVAPPGTHRRRPPAGRGGRRQRRGEPAGRRRVPRRAGPGRARTGSARAARGR